MNTYCFFPTLNKRTFCLQFQHNNIIVERIFHLSTQFFHNARENTSLMEALINSYANSPHSKGLNPNVMNKTFHAGNKANYVNKKKTKSKRTCFVNAETESQVTLLFALLV